MTHVFIYDLIIEMKLLLKAKTTNVTKVSEEEKSELFSLFRNFYDNVDYQTFLKDFNKKNKVIILYDSLGKAHGFSTISFFNHILPNGKKMRIFFSGDTIVHPDYWGKHNLNIQIAINMFIEKLKNPFKHNIWLLLTKGYKTYLLLTNSFNSYYPRYDKKTPSSIKTIMNSVGERFYSSSYSKETGIIYSKDKDKLVRSVAPIDAELCARVPKINFFQEQNPEWESGSELLCVGNISFYLLFVHYPVKLIRKQAKNLFILLGLKRKKQF